ncbi:MAG: hypothetical protein QM530_09690 [Phycisphaerales bacterium]|nr:hypothetical protein [Phycisphaerales bacterium]
MQGVFRNLFDIFLLLQEGRLDAENLNFDATRSSAKKAGAAIGYQYR